MQSYNDPFNWMPEQSTSRKSRPRGKNRPRGRVDLAEGTTSEIFRRVVTAFRARVCSYFRYDNVYTDELFHVNVQRLRKLWCRGCMLTSSVFGESPFGSRCRSPVAADRRRSPIAADRPSLSIASRGRSPAVADCRSPVIVRRRRG